MISITGIINNMSKRTINPELEHAQENKLLQELIFKFNLKTKIHDHRGRLNPDTFISKCEAIAKEIEENFQIDSSKLAVIIKYTSIKLDIYTDQRKDRINEGLKKITDATRNIVITTIRKNAMINTEIQCIIAKAIYDGQFSNDTNVLQELAKKLDVFTEKDAQFKVLVAIANGRFGNDTNVLLELAKKLHVFTDIDAPFIVSGAIDKDRFGNDTNVLLELAKKLHVFYGYQIAQRSVADAIQHGKFGDNKDVLRELAKKLDVFTDPYAQKTVANAIQLGKFGKSPNVLRELAINLRVFTDNDAQKTVANAIQLGKFGKDPNVLQQLKQLRFTNTDAQKMVDDAIQGSGAKSAE